MINLIGQIISHYHIIERLGEGGMATVYKAFDTHLERNVAIKVIRTDMIAPTLLHNLLIRFEREAKVLASFSHPNIVNIYDYGEHNDAPYLVMEYISGGTIKDRIKKTLNYKYAVRLLLPVARALSYAHHKNVVHRDVKPANILINDSGEIKLSDFGVAKVLEVDQATQITGTGVGIGTPDYMAPEQWVGEVTELSDQYSLGIIFYEMVTGSRPFSADTPAAVLLKQMNDPLPRPREFIPDLPEAVEQVLFKVLAKQPQDRYPDMNAVVQALEKLVAEETVQPVKAIELKKQGLPWIKIFIGIALLMSLCILVGIAGSQLFKRKQVINATQTMLAFESSGTQLAMRYATGTALVEETAPSPTATAALAIAALATNTPQPSPTIIHSPTLGIRATQVSKKDGMVMVYVPAGESLIGAGSDDEEADQDERPQHTIFLSAFWIDQTEVTNAMYALCVQASACQPPEKVAAPSVADDYYGNPLFDQFPVIYVSWHDAANYCAWAERRLPTEAEWEKAARGMDGQMYPWGNQSPNGSLVNLCDASCTHEPERDPSYNDNYPGVSQVGVFTQGASPYGALDMAGNVNEWVADFYDENYYSISPTTDPAGPSSGNLHVLRGGSSRQNAWYARTTHRAADWPNSNYSNLGFRCA